MAECPNECYSFFRTVISPIIIVSIVIIMSKCIKHLIILEHEMNKNTKKINKYNSLYRL